MAKITKVRTSDGQLHCSQKAADRWMELKHMEAEGKISKLRRNVKFILIDAQYEENNNRMGKPCIMVEKECSYIADFRYEQNGQTVVEDVNSSKKSGVYIIKRKLMLQIYHIKIREI